MARQVCDSLNILAKDIIKWPDGQEAVKIIGGIKVIQNKLCLPYV